MERLYRCALLGPDKKEIPGSEVNARVAFAMMENDHSLGFIGLQVLKAYPSDRLRSLWGDGVAFVRVGTTVIGIDIILNFAKSLPQDKEPRREGDIDLLLPPARAKPQLG